MVKTIEIIHNVCNTGHHSVGVGMRCIPLNAKKDLSGLSTYAHSLLAVIVTEIAPYCFAVFFVDSSGLLSK